ncbi:holdfast anchoring protein HfaA [Oceanicaulis sp.]|jgi:holdfast attachment protein HfaA|uniref:holdfast anchoring protein HfaA n=1 Tax=Oceanicaulis sp. TaxID=1924941 RepID=UPI003F718628
MTRQLKVWLCASGAVIFAASAALAQSTAPNPSDWTRPYGQAYGAENQAYVGARRGGNRVVLNGVIQTGVGVSAQTSAFAQSSAGVALNTQSQSGLFASAGASAIGNQLNVVVNGNYNTVVVNNRQTNTGDITANAGAVAATAENQTTQGASANDR